MKSKKGVIEIQFNWIFVLIAGALILTFFIIVVQKQKQVADVKLIGAIKADLSTILIGSQVSRGTSSLVDIPAVDIYYDCEGYAITNLQAIDPGISFSPNLLKGYNLMMWSLDWNVPFRVDNFLFITSPGVRYIFIKRNSGDNTWDDFYESEDNPSFPPRTIIQDGEERILFNKDLMIVSEAKNYDFENENNYKIRFIFWDDNIIRNQRFSNLQDIPDETVTALYYEPDNSCSGEGFDCFGEVIFYEKGADASRKFKKWRDDDDKARSYYLGRTSLIAAVFAEDPEHYNCNMRRAFKKLAFIAQVYLDKVDDLYDYYKETNNDNCKLISSASTALHIIIDGAEDLSEDFPHAADLNDIEEIYGQILVLENINNRLQRLSCAEIY